MGALLLTDYSAGVWVLSLTDFTDFLRVCGGYRSQILFGANSLGEADLWLAPHRGCEATGVV